MQAALTSVQHVVMSPVSLSHEGKDSHSYSRPTNEIPVLRLYRLMPADLDYEPAWQRKATKLQSDTLLHHHICSTWS